MLGAAGDEADQRRAGLPFKSKIRARLDLGDRSLRLAARGGMHESAGIPIFVNRETSGRSFCAPQLRHCRRAVDRIADVSAESARCNRRARAKVETRRATKRAAA